MKLLLLTAAFMCVASAFPNTEWTQYKEKHKKVYTSKQEDLARYNQYLKKKKMIDEHNMRYVKGETTYWMGINHFSDWFAEEIDQMLGYKPGKTGSRGEPFEPPAGTPVPDSINWVEKGAVTSVKDEGRCVSCYAFSAVASLEGLMFRTNKTITDLSAQELVDCDTTNLGCDGGLFENSFDYVKNRHGIDTNESYPYKADIQKCKAANGTIATTCTGYTQLQTENDLTKAVGTAGPASILFAADDSFLSYKGGVFDGKCAEEVNHALTAVGYDKDEKTGKDYWLMKSSWGVSWGEKGYARVIRNVNKCLLGNYGAIPVYSP